MSITEMTVLLADDVSNMSLDACLLSTRLYAMSLGHSSGRSGFKSASIDYLRWNAAPVSDEEHSQ